MKKSEKKEEVEELLEDATKEKNKKEEPKKETPKKEENKSNNILVTLLIVALLIVFFFIGYAVGGTRIINKISEKNNTEEKEDDNNTEEKEEVEEKITFTNSELEKYINYVSPISGGGPAAKLYNVDKVVASNLSSREKIEYAGGNIYPKHTTSSDYTYDIISEDEVKKVVEETYGKGTYERTTFNLACGDYIFHNDDNKYYSRTGCGGISDTIVENRIIDYKATKNKLEITTAYAFIDSNAKIYKDYDKKIILDDVNVEISEYKDYLTNYVKNNEDKLYHIVYVFESTDGINYYFKEFTNSKYFEKK